MALRSHFPVPKNRTVRKIPNLSQIAGKLIEEPNTLSNVRLHRHFSGIPLKKGIMLIPKTIENRKKEIVREVALGG